MRGQHDDEQSEEPAKRLRLAFADPAVGAVFSAYPSVLRTRLLASP